MLINEYNSKSEIIVFCCCFLLVFPPLTYIVGCVFSSLRWAGWSTALARLLARNLTSIRRALVVIVSCLAVLLEKTYYTALLVVITLTLVISLIGLLQEYISEIPFAKKEIVSIQYLQYCLIFLHQNYYLLSD